MSENTGSAKAQDEEMVVEKKRSPARKTSDPSFNLDEIRELAELVNEHGFTDFEFENENIRVRLSKMTAAPVVHSVQQAPAVQAAAPAPAPTETAPVSAAAEEDSLFKITSPIVGTFYSSPSPDKDP